MNYPILLDIIVFVYTMEMTLLLTQVVWELINHLGPFGLIPFNVVGVLILNGNIQELVGWQRGEEGSDQEVKEVLAEKKGGLSTSVS